MMALLSYDQVKAILYHSECEMHTSVTSLELTVCYNLLSVMCFKGIPNSLGMLCSTWFINEFWHFQKFVIRLCFVPSYSILLPPVFDGCMIA
jgi:hypothetical protein